jgi:hypothetical protein
MGRGFRVLVDVHFDEEDIGLFAQLLERGIDVPAGTAPGGVEVHNHGRVLSSMGLDLSKVRVSGDVLCHFKISL